MAKPIEFRIPTLPVGIPNEDVYAGFEKMWRETEWNDHMLMDKINKYRANYFADIPVPTLAELVADDGKKFNHAIRTKLIGSFMKMSDSINFASVADQTVGDVFGKKTMTGKEASALFYLFIKKNSLNSIAAPVPQTSTDALNALPSDLRATILALLTQKGQAIPEVAKAPVGTATLDSEISAMLKNLHVDQTSAAIPEKTTQVVKGKGKKGKK